jgi:uncharacterized membrane protein
VVSYLLLGEKVSAAGAAGIGLIALGSYLLNADGIKKSLLEPIRAIGRERGSLYMIGVAMLYSITSSMGKMAIEHSSPLFFGSLYFIAINIAFIPIALFMGRGHMQSFFSERKYRGLIVPGLLYGLMILAHMSAMKLTRVAYMVSVKRTSLLMGVLFGYFMFREGNLRGRFFGAALMFAGFVLIVVSG